MTDSNARKPPGRRLRDDSTLKDADLTGALASRVRREVALEEATEATTAREDLAGDERLVVVLGPDGVPQIADAVDCAPETVRFEVEEERPTKKPPPQPPQKR